MRLRTLARASAPGTEAGSARIGVLIEALEAHRQELNGLLQPLKVRGGTVKETHLALRTRLPSHHGVLSYMQHVHRDWAWGDDECGRVVDLLNQTLGDIEPTHICVLGSGAGRLAYDLQVALGAKTLWALDSNPLLCLVANKITNGKDIDLIEFPNAPIDGASVAVPRTLAGRPKLDGLSFVCADATRPPFAPAAFDLVITPWLIDVIDIGAGALMDIVAHLLQPGGRAGRDCRTGGSVVVEMCTVCHHHHARDTARLDETRLDTLDEDDTTMAAAQCDA